MAEWKISTDVVLQLLDAYKKYECLWNFKCDDYKQLSVRQNAWQRLADMFDTTPVMVKRKIKYLRSTYVSEKKKVQASMTSGDPNVAHRPRLFYFRKCKFLDSVIFLRNNNLSAGQTHSIEEDDVDVIEDELDWSMNFEHVSASTTDSAKSMKRKSSIDMKFEDYTLNEQTNSDIEDENDKTTTSTATIAHKRVKSAENSSEYRIPSKKMGSQDAVFGSAEANNLYIQFGRTVALQLGQLSPLEATSAMSTMHRYLSKKIVHALLRKKHEESLRREMCPDNVEMLSTLGESGEDYL